MTMTVTAPGTGPDMEFKGSDRWIQFGSVRYPYHLRYDAADELATMLGWLDADLFLLVSDVGLPRDLVAQTRRRISSTGTPCIVLKFGGGEQAKTMTSVHRLARKAVLAGATRRSVVVAFGGGLVGNIAGLLAGLLFRGIRLVHMPTTLLAASDSVLSLKQAGNLPGVGKNLVGMFQPPQLVFTDLAVLESLPRREIQAAMGEWIKNTLAIRPQDHDRVRALLNPDAVYTPANLAVMIELCIEAKCSVMADDPREEHDGLVLEYGHTCGHVIEQRAGVPHGLAVGIGMCVAAAVGRRLGQLDEAAEAAHFELLRRNGAPTRLPNGISPEAILDGVRLDNKRGRLRAVPSQHVMVVLERLGRPYRTDGLPLMHVPDKVLHAALRDLARAT